MNRKIKLGIIGIGNMGTGHATKVHIQKLCPDIDLVAVADINPERLEWCRENLGEEVRRFDTAEAMLDSGLIDSCIVAVPHYDHPKYAIACMRRGIHVMVEKPAGVYTKQVLEMNAESEKHPDVVFGLMFNQRTNHIYRKMHEIIHGGEYGQLRRVNWLVTNWFRTQAYYDSGAWRATWSGEGGGVLMNQCPHQLDLLQWLCGMPKKVHAHMRYGHWHDIEVEDDVTAYLEFENGAVGTFITTTSDPRGTNRLEIQLEKAKLVAEAGQLTVEVFDCTVNEAIYGSKKAFEKLNATPLDFETDGLAPQHVGVLNAWAGHILRGEPLIAHGTEGIREITLANAMYLSSWLDKAVEIPFDHDLYFEELSKRIRTSRRKENIEAVLSDTSGSYEGTTSIEEAFNNRWNTNW